MSDISIKIIQHEISYIGKVDICLFGCACDLYNKLESDGIINYLKNLDHLGFIAKAHPGNNHKRWDYVCLQLNLLQKLKHSLFDTGLSHTLKEFTDSGRKITKLEYLQCVVLISNLGHIDGTLAAEKALLLYLKGHQNRKNLFLSRINGSPRWMTFVNSVIDNNEFYKMKYLIGLNYIMKEMPGSIVEEITYRFLNTSLIQDEAKFRKLKQLFFKIRQISFVYIDSYNSDFPFQISVHKILMNIYHYEGLFRSKTKDFDSFFEACESALTSKLYLSIEGAYSLSSNTEIYLQKLKSYCSKGGQKKLLLDDFLLSLIRLKYNLKPINVQKNDDLITAQFYISDEELQVFGTNVSLFRFEQGIISFTKKQQRLQSLFNRGLTNDVHSLDIIQDNRKTKLFLNMFIDKRQIPEGELSIFIENYKRVFLEFYDSFEFSNSMPPFKTVAHHALSKHIARKFFLFLYKILFDHSHRQDVFIKYEYQALADQIRFETGLAERKKDFEDELTRWIDNLKRGPHKADDILNNLLIIRNIIQNEIQITHRRARFLYCFLPTQIDEILYDAKSVMTTGNPEVRGSVTDIDAAFMVFDKNNFQLFIIEGKDSKGFRKSVNKDFRVIKNRMLNAGAFSDVNFVTHKCRGGYIKIEYLI